jgi:hypothetical protein
MSVKQEQLDALKAAWKRAKYSLDREPATKEVHRAYESMEKLFEVLQPAAPSETKGSKGEEV